MSFDSKPGGGGGGEMDIDLLGEGKVINLESEVEGAAGGDGCGSPVGASIVTDELDKSFQDLLTLEGDGTKRMELISKLEASRTQVAEEERRARRAAWTEEARKVILERQLFQESGTTEVFPELVWEQIFKNVDDPKEKGRLAKMSQLWRGLLKKERTTFLFNEVFALLHARGHLPRDDILLFRSVSREWRSSTDNWIQNFSHFPMQTYLQVRKIRPLIGYDKVPIRFQVDVRRVGVFSILSRQNFPPEGNPFFSRTLVVGCVCPHTRGDNMTFWLELERLLALWGREVWTLKIQLSRSNPNHFDSSDAFQQIVSLLRLLPNLRHLVLLSPGPMAVVQHAEFDMLRLKKCMTMIPLPELPHLRSLVASKIPAPMTKAMLEKFGPTLDTFITYEVGGDLFENAQLPNLRVMMRLVPPQVEPLTMNWPAIREMNLHYDTAVAADIPNIFRNLADVGGTLRKLNLILENENGSSLKLDNATVKMLTLELPNLEELSLSMCLGQGNLKTIDFLLPMTKLKMLSLTYVKGVEVGETDKKPKTKRGPVGPQPRSSKQKEEASGSEVSAEIIKYWKYTNRLYESNIWLLFPELRNVTIVTFLMEMLGRNHPSGLDAVIDKAKLKEKSFTREEYFKKNTDKDNKE